MRGITSSTVNGVLLGPDVVLKKSAKGRDEITTRAHKLALNLRRILILVDGDQTIAAITELTSGMTKVEESLSLLIDLGFLEVSGLRVDETQTLQIIPGPAAHLPDAAHAKASTVSALVPAMKVGGFVDLSDATHAANTTLQAKKAVAPSTQNDSGPVSGFQERLAVARGDDRGPTSDQAFAAKGAELIRVANENAIKKAVTHAAAVEDSLTIPPSGHYKKLTTSGLAPMSSDKMSPHKLNAAKAALIVEARRLLGADAERVIPKIQAVETVNDVMDWVLKFREYFLLSGKDEAENFVTRIQEMLR